MAEEKKEKTEVKGLKRLRVGYIGQVSPEYKCENCGCMRYNECGCMRKKGA